MKEKQQIFDLIKQYDDIIIVRHIRPDGDCIGSTIGLRDILRASFPHKQIYSVGNDDSQYLAFLGAEDVVDLTNVIAQALVIVVDTATSDRIDYAFWKEGQYTIKIDHHLRVEDYADLNYVREDLPATAAIITDFWFSFKEELLMPQSAAQALFVGLVTDTGRVKYRGVNSLVMRMAAELIATDIDIVDIYAHLYIKSKESFHLQGYVLNHYRTSPHGVAYMFITKRLQKKFKVTIEEASALVNTLDSIKGYLVWIFFVQGKEKIRVRLRSRFVDVNER
ncbi:MAG TPA: bifunctional oligoribonuclease/PAP phosphatase NrnA [Bacilli bacterium]|nr:bifunctional oligoribonuclease/PAP phosphatase NrnA [Bacilli bacterium]